VRARKPVWKTSSFLVYIGGLTVLFGAVLALAYLNGHFGKGALTGWALLILVVLRFIAEVLRVRGRWVAGGIFSFASVIAWGVFVGLAWWWFGWLNNWHSPFGGWSLAHLSLEFLILVVAAAEMVRSGFPFIALISTVVGWFFVTDFISNGGTWTYIVTLAIGLLYLLAGSVGRAPASFWLHFVGGLLIGIPLLHWWHTSTFDWALISAVAFVFVGIAYATRRSSWAVYATIAFFAATIYFVGGSPTQIAAGLVGGGVSSGGQECVSTATGQACQSIGGASSLPDVTSSSVAGWSWALAFGLLGFWLVLLGLIGRRSATAPAAVSPAA
jgi:hypothetical protein